MDNLDGKGLDLIKAVDARLAALNATSTPATEARYERAYNFISRESKARDHAMFTAEAGPYGTSGRMVDITNGTPQAFTRQQAAMVPMYGMVMRPSGARYALFFTERRSTRNLRKPFEDGVLKKIASDAKIKFDMRAHVDTAAWERFLESADVAEVTAVYRSTRAEDYLPDTRSRPGLTIAAEGGAAKRLGKSAMRAAIDKAKGNNPNSVLIGDLQPKNGEQYERERVTIVASDADDRRTVDIEQGELPQWVYRTDGRMTRKLALETWSADAIRILKGYGVDVTPGWHTVK